MNNSEYNRFKRRIAVALVLYFIFVFFLMYEPEYTIGSTVFSMLFIYGIAFVILLAIGLVLIFASGITGLIIELLGNKEWGADISKSVNKATGLIPTSVVIALIAIPAYMIYSMYA